ncbi:MAG: hypothetical protein PHU21_07460 [Elusimicrobia bacterium]|nr:hypothetical protein [Elusimicrobiota bacterium]
MNQRAKGARHEKAVADHLAAQGFLTERGFKRVAFIRGRPMPITKDLFAAFDICAIRPPSEVRFIQVTAGAVAPRRAKAFAVWGEAEVWEHLRAGIYRVHRHDRTEVVDAGQAARTRESEKEV